MESYQFVSMMRHLKEM